MFSTNEGAEIEKQLEVVERDYIIKVNDLLKVNLFTNEGEQLIDPNFEQITNVVNPQFQQQRDQFTFLVQTDGTIKLPLIGKINVDGLTIDDAEARMEERYDEFYKGAFVKLQFLNKRVVVLGQQNVVIPLDNQNVSLLEVIALAGGIPFGAKAQNVKIIRGNLQNPEVFVIDLSTSEGMKGSIVQVQDGDIIYIEPWRRPWLESVRDASPVLGVISSITALVFVVVTLTNN